MRFLGKLAGKLTYANVVATLALFIALGGASYAAVKLPKNSVGRTQIKKGSITIDKLSKSTLNSLKGVPGPAGANGRDGAQGPPGIAGYSEVFSKEGSANIANGALVTVAQTENLPASGAYFVNAELKLTAGPAPINFSCSVGPYSGSGGENLSVYKTVNVAANATATVHFAEVWTINASYYVYVGCLSNSGAASAVGKVSAVPYDDYIAVK